MQLNFVRWLANGCKNTTIDVDDLAVHKVTGRRRKEYRGACQVFGIAPAACRRTVDDKLVERMTVDTDRRSLLRCKIPGTNTVHLDVVLRPFSGHVLGQHL